MAKNNNLTDFVTDLADAVRDKCKTTGTINPQDFSKFVGGMPFFKFRETVDITANANDPFQLSLSYNKCYVKGIVYLTNDNGLNSMPTEFDSALIVAEGLSTDILFYLKNTSERIDISGYWEKIPFHYFSHLQDDKGDGQTLIDSGWHVKVDIYDLCIGNPDGENTKLDLNNATGGGV